MVFDMLAATASAVHPPIHWVDLGLHRGIDIFGFQLRYYSLAYLIGIIFGYWHLSREIRSGGAPLAQRHADDLFFWCTLGVILGGRLGYALFYTGGASGIPSMFAHPIELLKLWQGGMSFHGGFLGVTVAIVWVCRKDGLRFIRVCDYIAPCAPFGLFLGRCANFINGELWGRAAGANVPWAMVFPDGGPLPRHPSQLYEAGLEGLMLFAILVPTFWLTRARWRPGLLSGLFVAGYGVARFVVEMFREPDAQLQDFAARTGLSMGQWLTVPMVLVGLFLIARAVMRPEINKGLPAQT